MDKTESMHIKQLTIENFLRISVVDITPDGNVIYITGHNGEGKTSVLNAIWVALSNPRYSEMPKPVKEGEEKAIITLDLNKYLITRTFTEKDGATKTVLKVEGAEGAQFLSPQKLLDTMIGALTFDPLEFIGMKGKDQVEMLLKLAGGEIDIEAMDIARQNAYDQRTAVNQSVKTLSAARGEEPEKIEKVDLSEIQGNIEASNKLREDIRTQTDRARTLVNEIAERQDKLDNINSWIDKAKTAHEKYKPYDELKFELDEGILNNQNVGDWEKWDQAGKDIVTYSDKANEYKNQIDGIDEKKKSAIAALKFPYPGLSFGEGGVVYNKIPLKQASKAEQIRVSLAIAMALNPKLRVIRIEDGSLLDEKNLKLIHELAVENDYQVWVERVKGAGEGGIIIEDGMIKDAT